MSKGAIKKVSVALTISRSQHSDDRKVISLMLEDRASGIQFVDVDFPLEAFMEALTGLAYREGEGQVRGLENVGKVKETEQALYVIPKKAWEGLMSGGYDGRIERVSKYVKEAFAREGWYAHTIMGSQNAYTEDGDIVRVRGYYTRYVDKE